MNKWIALLFAALMMLSLLTACGEDSSTPDDGNSTPAGNTSVSNGEDPCSCCPDCIQEECDCVECGDNADCKCKLPGGLLTYKVQKKIEFNCTQPDCPFHEKIEISGEATTTVGSGSAEGTAQYDSYGQHGLAGKPGVLVFETLPSYSFNTQLSVSPTNKNNIVVGFDRMGLTEETLVAPDGKIWGPLPGVIYMCFHGIFDNGFTPDQAGYTIDSKTGLCVFNEKWGGWAYDPGTKLMLFELPMSDGTIQKTFSRSGVNGSLNLTIILTPVP